MSDVSNATILGSAGISAGAGLAGGLLGLLNTKMVNDQNLAVQKEEWRRQDTAYQRLAEDLQKAGFSKNILSGVSSGLGSSTNFKAQRADMGFLSDSIDKGLEKYYMYERLRLDQESQKAQVTYQKKTVDQINAQIEHLNLQNKALADKLEYYEKLGIPEGVMSNDLTKIFAHNAGIDFSNVFPIDKIDVSDINMADVVKSVLDWSFTSRNGFLKTLLDNSPKVKENYDSGKNKVLDFITGVLLGLPNKKYWKSKK